jgi:cell division protein FtsW
LGSGGWFGVGLGASRQKWAYVPNAHTDFIFAILGEEMGLFGTVVVLGMFGFLAYLGIRTARKAKDRFGMLIASGITIWITVQALVNIGAVTGSLPITGVPLPLVSFGGTSLVISLMAVGILINVARQGRDTQRKRSASRSG